MSNKKIKVLTLGDHPLSPSGVGTQCNYIFQALVRSGKFKIFSLGGAIKHQDYRPIKFQEFGDDYIIQPIDGYGSQDLIRNVLRKEKPDVLWMMTDPRFYTWLWEIEQEIRPNVPIMYYHVWDNYPYPKFNRGFYLSNDKVCTISKLTSDIVRTVAPEVEEEYVPHAVNSDIFKILDEKEYQHMKSNKTVFFWTNRNARRKMSGSVVWWFKEFLDKVGHDKAFLLMHTDPKDPNGQDLIAIADELGLTRENFGISAGKVPAQEMAKFYNACDCTINISDAEGFGLSVLESLSCGTPVIATRTGGMQDQLTDGTETFGVLVEPASSAIIGSQDVPYIYEDRISKESFIAALEKIHNMTREQRKELGKKGFDYVQKNFNFNNFQETWVKIFTDFHEKNGSWETRKLYKSFEIKEF